MFRRTRKDARLSTGRASRGGGDETGFNQPSAPARLAAADVQAAPTSASPGVGLLKGLCSLSLSVDVLGGPAPRAPPPA